MLRHRLTLINVLMCSFLSRSASASVLSAPFKSIANNAGQNSTTPTTPTATFRPCVDLCFANSLTAFWLLLLCSASSKLQDSLSSNGRTAETGLASRPAHPVVRTPSTTKESTFLKHRFVIFYPPQSRKHKFVRSCNSALIEINRFRRGVAITNSVAVFYPDHHRSVSVSPATV